MQSSKISKRDRVLEALASWIDTRDYPPSMAELSEHTGTTGEVIPSTSCSYLLTRLLREGRVRVDESGNQPRWFPLVYPDGRPWVPRSELLAASAP